MKSDAGKMNPELRNAPLWAASRALLYAHGEEFFSRWKKLAQSFDQEGIHDLRVSSRRLREGLSLFSPLFPGKERKRVSKGVKRVTRMLGEMRNLDEALLLFLEIAGEKSCGCEEELRELLKSLRGEREEAHRKLEEAFLLLDQDALRQEYLLLQGGQNLFEGAGVDPFAGITSFAARGIVERGEPVAELLPMALREEDGAAQHQLRIAVKKLRYRMEILSPLLLSGYRELHDTLKGYQDALGKLHDLDVFMEMVRKRLREGAGREALLQVMAQRRRALYGSFAERNRQVPVADLAGRIIQVLEVSSQPRN